MTLDLLGCLLLKVIITSVDEDIEKKKPLQLFVGVWDSIVVLGNRMECSQKINKYACLFLIAPNIFKFQCCSDMSFILINWILTLTIQ